MTRIHLTATAALILGLAACTPKNSAFDFEKVDFADSTAHAYLTMKVELPVAGGAASRAVRSALLDLMDQSLSHADTYVEERAFPRFSGNTADTDALMAYYEEQTLRHVDNLARGDYDERERAIRENAELSAAEKDEFLADFPKWSYELNLEKIADTERYLVFSAQEYVYMGGAHGGVIGAGFPTFDRQDGHHVTPVLRPDCTEDIQPLLVSGLLRYFKECGEELTEESLFESLILEQERLIPLPTWDPYPTRDGLVFTYQQYEIAPYAVGMPSFVILFGDIRPFLSADAARVFGQ